MMPSGTRAARGVPASPELIRFVEAYLSTAGLASTGKLAWEGIAGEGSGRRFYRVQGKGARWVVMANSNPPQDRRGMTENDSFLYIARHLRGAGAPVPEIYHHDMAQGWFLMEDMGDCHLQTEALRNKGDQRQLYETYKRVIDCLALIQVEGRAGFDPARTHNPPYDERFMLTWESGYFYGSFLQDYLGLTIPEEELRAEFAELARQAGQAPGGYFLYRDFQSRNIMVRDDGLGLLDFQGGRLGPLQYDLASLLLDPYVELDQATQAELFSYYVGRVQGRVTLDPAGFREQYAFIALHRAMQILGAFAFLTKQRGLAFFQAYIPPAVRGLRILLSDARFASYKKLKRVVFEESKGI
jgi:aminoglycoside/choline kinase family phosphotransferase